MNYSNDFINRLIEEEMKLINQISSIYYYPDNITHLLYLIVPAFIMKYGIKYKKLIEECFFKVPIMIEDKQNQIYQAYYFSKPKWEDNHIVSIKGIVLQNYKNISLIQLLDNLVHEFNHAVNSIQNEIQVKDNILFRTGISYHYFDAKTLQFLKRGEETVIEEVMNTRQSELIIDIIRSFTDYTILNSSIQNTIYSIFHATDSYHSNSYFLESYVCRELLQNKTFFSTLEVLRFEGKIDDIHLFFDSIVNKPGAFLELSRYLSISLNLQQELVNNKWFKKRKIKKIKKVNKAAFNIVHAFNQNTIYR